MPIRNQDDAEQLKIYQQKLQLCSKDGSINFNISSGTNPLGKDELVEHEKGEEPNVTMCLVCKINNAKFLLTNYYSILEKCFGITVSDPSLMICCRCAHLVRTTSEFRELIRDSINQNTIAKVNQNTKSSVRQNNEQVESQPHDNTTVLPITVTKSAAQSLQRRGNNPVGKRIITACKYCKHKYPMLVHDEKQLEEVAAFVCARCKHTRPVEHNIQCGQCRTVVPAHSMYNHLEKHAIAARENLLSRTRLRSLQDPLSRRRHAAQTLEDQQVIQHVQKHLKTHECQVCGKIFKKQETLTRHYKIHRIEPHNIPLS